MTNKKNRSKKQVVVTCERTYVSERCSRAAFIEHREISTRRSTTSPSQPLAQEVPSRHHRRGAVRSKRSVSLKSPRPVEQREDNPYVETSFVDVPLSQPTPPRPFIDFSTLSEELLNKPVGPNAEEATDGVKEFPPYVTWVSEGEESDEEEMDEDRSSGMCRVCKLCRCKVCQRKCKWLRITICGVSIPTDGLAGHLPFVNGDSPCLVCSIRREREVTQCWSNVGPCSEHCRPGYPSRAIARSAELEREDADTPTIPSTFKERMYSLVSSCFPCLGHTMISNAPLTKCPSACPDKCKGNVNVAGCLCIDWVAVRAQRRRARDTAAAADSSSSAGPSTSSGCCRHNNKPASGRDRNNTSSTMRSASRDVSMYYVPASSASIFGCSVKRMTADDCDQNGIDMQPLSTILPTISIVMHNTSDFRPDSNSTVDATDATAVTKFTVTTTAMVHAVSDRQIDIEIASLSSASGIDNDISNASLVSPYGGEQFNNEIGPLPTLDNDVAADADNDNDSDDDDKDVKYFVDTTECEFYPYGSDMIM